VSGARWGSALGAAASPSAGALAQRQRYLGEGTGLVANLPDRGDAVQSSGLLGPWFGGLAGLFGVQWLPQAASGLTRLLG